MQEKSEQININNLYEKRLFHSQKSTERLKSKGVRLGSNHDKLREPGPPKIRHWGLVVPGRCVVPAAVAEMPLAHGVGHVARSLQVVRQQRVPQ